MEMKIYKTAEEILYMLSQNNWAYSVQQTESGTVFINCVTTGLNNVSEVNSSIVVTGEHEVTIIARKVYKCDGCDNHKVYKLLNDLNSRSPYVIFHLIEGSGGTYIQARYDLYHAISNKPGVCLNMVTEMAGMIDVFLPDIRAALD